MKTGVLEIASLDLGFGADNGRDFALRSICGHEGRGTGKTDPYGGYDLVIRKKN